MIAAERAAAMGEAIRTCVESGGSVYLLTLTLRHSEHDALADLWNSLSSGWRSLFGVVAWTGKRSRVERGKLRPARIGDADIFRVAGLTRTVEVTGGGPAGWHVHIHCLVFTEATSWSGVIADDWQDRLRWMLPGLECSQDSEDRYRDWLAGLAFASRCMIRWKNGLARKGFECGSAGVDVRRIDDAGAEFLGGYLTKATYDAAYEYDAADEVTAGQTRKSGRGGGQPPFRMLYEAMLDESVAGWFVRTPRRWDIFQDEENSGLWLLVDLDTAEVVPVQPPKAWRLWWEYETASKGRRQLIWSRRIKNPETTRHELWNKILDARGIERDDADIASDEIGGEVLGTIAASSWYRQMVTRPVWLADALEAAETGGAEGISSWMDDRGIDWSPAHSRDVVRADARSSSRAAELICRCDELVSVDTAQFAFSENTSRRAVAQHRIHSLEPGLDGLNGVTPGGQDYDLVGKFEPVTCRAVECCSAIDPGLSCPS
ncbi:hypothetical protein [Gordonia sp. QH-12]|uniref:hypothetical protein n=1 Tax=Gordonia sp. QH-12 TaxID=1437876 RepID=UPI0012E91A04|nr:hypothetical protein [Gordonia sp. QH-12]